ncbi:YeiH family putative sulfate export transporter, partial [Rhizobiaceae sp. 2RAB30]
VPVEAKAILATLTTILLSVGLAALGLQADIGEIRARGLRPLILALSAFLFIAGFSLSLVKLVL